MTTYVTGWALGGMLSISAISASLAADDVTIAKDLTAVIALQGLPCGQVISVERRGDNDYVVACRDGNRYRVFVNPQGRVVVQRQ